MINRTAITQWNKIVPWNDNAQVEQDLIISRALVAIFSDKFLASQLAFRGGTALHKLYLSPQPRYSEDIDLVQITPGPIKPIMFKLGEVLSFLPDRVTKQKRYNNTMLFRMESEIPPTIPLRLKIEINCFEHFNELGLVKVPFEVENSWFSGKCEITTYRLNELLGTKLRALYQRKKGRDLFDLYVALSEAVVDINEILRCYNRYMSFVVQQPPTYKHFNELGLVKVPFEVENSWFSGKCEITTYRLNELLGTKLRALYQRKKGRDLFDLYVALSEAVVDINEILRCYNRYMSFVVQQPPTYKQFINNMEEKMLDPDFLGDTQNLIRPDREFNPRLGYELVLEKLIERMRK